MLTPSQWAKYRVGFDELSRLGWGVSWHGMDLVFEAMPEVMRIVDGVMADRNARHEPDATPKGL